MKLYSIKDNKVGIFDKPFRAINNMEATRQLHTAVNDEKFQISMYPEDFDLYLVAEFDEKTGMISGPIDNDNRYDGPIFVVGAVSLKKLEAKNG